MKILIVGSNKEFALEKIYAKYMNLEDCEVDIFPAKDLFLEEYNKFLFAKILHRFLPSRILSDINYQLIKAVETFKPDIVWVFKGQEINPETLKRIKEKGVFICNYNADHPFIIYSRGSGNKNVRDSIGLYNLHFAYSKSVVSKIAKDFKIETKWLPFGFDLPKETFEKAQLQSELKKICFLGNPDKIRADMILHIAKNGYMIDVYGHGWNKYVSHPNVKTNNAVFIESMWMTLRRYRVQLNIFRPHNMGSHNMRSFEVPAIGGIMLAPETVEHNSFFEKGDEYFSYKDHRELIEKAHWLLSLDDIPINLLRNNARHKSISGNYTYKDRANTVKNILINTI